MRKTYWPAILLTGLLFLFIQHSAWAERPVAGEVSRVQGAATVLRAEAPVPLMQGDSVFSGDTLTTEADARLELAMADGTVLTLGGGSRLELTGYLWQEEAGTGLAVLNLAKGAFRAVTGGLTDMDNPQFAVTTPLATIGIRGTDFWGGYLQANVLDVLFVAGNKKIEITNAQGTTLLEHPGQGATVPAPGQAPTPPKVWPDAKRQRAFDTVSFSP